jgi:HD-like signal output (HDOD) protein
VVYLGINTVKNMALSFATLGILPSTNAAGFDIQYYLMHSLITANVARMLAIKYADDEADPNDCYIAGLLHDFGKVVYVQFLPADFSKALALSEAENLPLHVAEEILNNHRLKPVGWCCGLKVRIRVV